MLVAQDRDGLIDVVIPDNDENGRLWLCCLELRKLRVRIT